MTEAIRRPSADCDRPRAISTTASAAAGAGGAGTRLRPDARRLRLGAEVPAPDGPAPAAARLASASATTDALHMVRHTLDRMALRRHLRPPRRRLPPLQHRRALARAALREDALRQRPARARLPRGVPGDRRPVLSRDRRGDARLRAARDDQPRGAVLQHARRRQRGRGGQVLRLDGSRDRSRSSARPTPQLFSAVYDVEPRRQLATRTATPAEHTNILHRTKTFAQAARLHAHERDRAARAARRVPKQAVRRSRPSASGPAATTRC